MNIQKIKPVMLGLILAISTVVMVNCLEDVAATDRYVGGGGVPNYSSISTALAASSSGDTIYVAYSSVPYNDNVVIQISINIIGVMSGSNRPIITGSNMQPIFDIIANDIVVKIENLEINGGGTNNIAGIRSSADPDQEYGVEIDNCVIYGFPTTGCGIRLYDGANFHWIHDCVIYNNGDGINMVTGNSQVGNENCLVEDCEIYSNSDEGIYNEGDYNWFIDNIIHNNGDNGIELYDSDLCWIASSYDDSNTEIYENEVGIFAQDSDDLTIIGSADDDYAYQVYVHNNDDYGIKIIHCFDLQISYTTTDNNGNDYREGLYAIYSNSTIINNIYFNDGMRCINCHYWTISYYHIPSYLLTSCTNFIMTNPI